MMIMSELNPEPYREQLLQLKAALEEIEETSQQAGNTVQLDQQSVGRLSRIDALQAQQMAQASEQRRQETLTRIQGALRRIEAGTFGECFVCGELVDERRLSVDPTTTRCLACAEAEE
jgi:DnaK suppressor protein